MLVEGGESTDRGLKDGYYLSPFVYRMEHGSKVRSIREEVFGPHVALIPFKNNEDAARIYNDTDYGLSMAVITESYPQDAPLPRGVRVRHGLCEPAVHRGGGASALRRREEERQRPPEGRGPRRGGHAQIAWTVNHGTEIKMAQGLSAEVDLLDRWDAIDSPMAKRDLA